jgi:uncharacterized protein YjbJ (UPF0337 family)
VLDFPLPLDKAAGKAQHAYGSAKDEAREVVNKIYSLDGMAAHVQGQ